jgi:hypothetical protein
MAGSLQAHHSLAGVYDMKAEKEVAGTVEKVQFVNPHGSMSISVKNQDGTATEWVFTLGSATALAERGLVKPGRMPSMSATPLRLSAFPLRTVVRWDFSSQ